MTMRAQHLGQWGIAMLVGCVLAASAIAGEVDYSRDIKPILATHCYKCHGPDKQENGLRLDTAAAGILGGDSGAAIVPQKADESLILQAIQGTSSEISKMPPEGDGLTADQIALLKQWIAEGAKFPADEKPLASQATGHWSFIKPVRAVPPETKQREWSRSAMDAFILARLEKEGIAPSEEAHRDTLLRRVYLDLVGILPSPEEIKAFREATEPDAYERVVDQLLASPHHGERMGRHWLDLARYADSNGYTRDFPRQIWKYREWVIDAINAGMPFDQFTIEQMAGDMLPKATSEQLVATGFHRNTLFNEEGGTDQEQFRVEAIADRVATTGSVFLGLTLGCARCHTHKYDPITQAEYYQLFALLNNCDEPTLEVPTKLQLALGELERREAMRAKVKELEQELEKQRPALETAQQAWEKTVTPQQRARLPGPVQVAYDMAFEKRDAANKKLIENYYKETEEARKAFPLVAELHELRQKEPKIPSTMILRERSKPRETYIHKRGDFLNRGAVVQGGVPAALPAIAKQAPKDAATISEATRLDFAKWLVSSDNPLTPRVTINRDWLLFFGRGIVETEDDFGKQGSLPTHPELIDFLAREFADHGWDVKRMRRMMVCSSTYRQASKTRTDLHEKDPQNRLLARQSRLRLDAEIVRDVELSAAGLLTEELGGPSVFPPQPDGVYDFTQDPKNWKAATGSDRYRRGMYTHFWRSAPYPALMVFDSPGGNVTCTRRIRSNTPMQALTLANDLQFLECAQNMALRVLKEATGDEKAQCDFAFQVCVSRLPTSAEREQLLQLITAERETLVKSPERVTQLLPKESKIADASQQREFALWAQVCRVLLNLDETITRE